MEGSSKQVRAGNSRHPAVSSSPAWGFGVYLTASHFTILPTYEIMFDELGWQEYTKMNLG
jgi:hypothetical protein